MRFLLILILTSWTIWSCGTNSSTDDKGTQNDFQVLISNIKALETGYTYDIVKQDTEDCYEPKNSDTLFYNPPFPILGQFNNGTIYSVIHFEPGDDMWPIIRTFDKDGKSIDRATIVFGNCAGWDCDFDECDEKFKLINSNTIESVMTIVTTPCDSRGKKDSTLTEKEIRKKTVMVDDSGKLIINEEKTTDSKFESFDEFYKKFTTDSLFQIERVKFPWTVMTWELGEESPVKELINKEDWRFGSFYYEDGYATRQIDAYTQKIKNYGDTIKLEIRGVDNGIFIDYNFTKDKNKWFLVSEKDYSN